LSSLSEQERRGLDDLFLCLGKEQSLTEKIREHQVRFLSTLSHLAKKGIPLGLTYVKSKKIMFKEQSKMAKYKLFNHFRPKNRGPK
jgi:hypothetical protein